MSHKNAKPGLVVIFLGALVAFGFLLFFSRAANSILASEKSSWVDAVGAGIMAPACGSSSIGPSCSGGLPSTTFTWAVDESWGCGSVSGDYVSIKIWKDAEHTDLAHSVGNLSCSGTYTWNGGSNDIFYWYEILAVLDSGNTEHLINNDPTTEKFNTLDCALPPQADIKANGSDSPSPIPNNTSATISWVSSNANLCSVSPCPPGPGGTCNDLNNTGRNTGNLTSSQIYTLSCTGPGSAGPDLTTGPQTISGGPLPTSVKNAFDDNMETQGRIGSSGNTYIGQDFGSPRNIRRVKIFSYFSGNTMEFHAKLQYSDNVGAWSDTNVNNIDISGGPIQWYEYSVNDYGAHRYWRFLDTQEAPALRFSEIKMMEQNPPVTDSVTVNVSGALVNQPPVANATISTDGVNYFNAVTVTRGVQTPIYLSAAGSSDFNGWGDIQDNGKCEWNNNLNQGAPVFDSTINNPSSPAACNVNSIPNPTTFNDAPGAYTYQVLRIFDGTDFSNTDTVQVIVSAVPTFALNVNSTGATGVIMSGSPAGALGVTPYANSLSPGTPVTLTAPPVAGFAFNGWSGACTGVNPCNVIMDANKAVTANYTAVASTFTLIVKSTIASGASITGSPPSAGGTANPAGYTRTFDSGTPVTLTSNPVAGFAFNGWSVGCTGPNPCGVTMDSNKTVIANYSIVAITSLACSVSPSSILQGESATWTADATGGTPPYTFTWTSNNAEGPSGTGNSKIVQYNQTGTKTGSVSVVDSMAQSLGPVSCDNSLTVTVPECADGDDNDGDGLVNCEDPGCHTDGNPNNPLSCDPDDDDETNSTFREIFIPFRRALAMMFGF